MPEPTPESSPAATPRQPAATPRQPAAAPRRETAQTLDRGLRLLELVADTPAGVPVAVAAAHLGVGRAVVYRLAATLAEHGLIRRATDGRLHLATGVLRLAHRAQPMIAERARPVLRRLAERVGATAHLTVADGDEAVALLAIEPSWTQLHVAYRTGSRHPLGRGAAGRALRAALDGGAGRTGWTTSSGELQAGAHGVAAPVPGVAGLVACVGVVALSPLDAATIGPLVGAAAAQIARALD